MTALSPRLLAALGVGPGALLRHADGSVMAQVDDVDHRFRDAIKAGARAVSPPAHDPHLGRSAQVLDDSVEPPVPVVLLAQRGRGALATLEPRE